jgi:3-oxoacyl-[acyl-carrier-protein] synthase II
MGVLAPNGTGLKAFWQSLMAGESGIGPITLFDASGFKSRIAGEVKNFNPDDYFEQHMKPRRMARHTQLAFAATKLALNDAGFGKGGLDFSGPIPVVVGVSTSSLDVIERVFHHVSQSRLDRVTPFALGASKPQAAANVIADYIGSSANASTISSACPSGLDAVAAAASMIRRGEADLAIAGGADAPITPLAIASFAASGLSSVRNSDPQTASRPFDLTRDSGVISEGAGIFVLEDFESADARGARIYCEIAGFGTQRDMGPDRPASGLEQSIEIALANARCTAADIDYISAYGPGHPVLDAAEIAVVKRVFGRHAYAVPISSIKGVTGNPLAAAGPFQIVSCALSFRDQIIPPTANHETPDPDCDLDIIPNRPRKMKVARSLVNVRGLGGSASAMVLERVESI